MKKTFSKGSIFVGILASSLFINAQTAGRVGSGAAGGAAGTAGAPGAGTAAGAISPGGNVAASPAGAAAGASATDGTLNTVGAAGVNQPAASTPIGGASVIGPAPNTIGGSRITAQNPGAPGAAGTVGTLPGSGVLPPGSAARQSVQPGALGDPVRTGDAGVIQPNFGTIADVQAGIPLTTLPRNLQQSIQTRLGNSQVQTISRDDLANGSVFRVTTLQNGVPTEMRFGANGAFLGSTVLPGTATSFVTPGGGPTLEALPTAVQSTIRGQVGDGRIGNIVPRGEGYVVTYDLNGQPTTMLVGPDGRIVRAGPTAVGAPPASAAGSGATANPAPRGATNNNNRTSSIPIDDLPDEVRDALKSEAPNASVQFINREQRAGGEVYVVGARNEDEYVQLTFDKSGRVIRDTRDVEVLALGAPAPTTPDLALSIPFSSVPMAIRNTVNAYAANSDVRSVNLGLDQGRTVFDIIFMQDGRRDRLIVAKDGSLIRRERDVPATLDNSRAKPRLAIGDLPAEVRDTIRRQTDNVLVKDVGTKRIADQVVYSVRYETNGVPFELLVDGSGTIVRPETTFDTPGSPLPAPAKDDSITRVIPAAEIAEAAGTPAPGETGPATSNATSDHQQDRPLQKVRLSDVPPAVQHSAKNLAGSGAIQSINPILGDDGVIYEVTVSNEGRRQTLRLNQDGEVQENPPTNRP
jgi:uncharacterized membrane protein YkoI